MNEQCPKCKRYAVNFDGYRGQRRCYQHDCDYAEKLPRTTEQDAELEEDKDG